MKKWNPVFLGECVIIVALLLVIGFLIKDRTTPVYGKESEDETVWEEMSSAAEETAETHEGTEAFLSEYGEDVIPVEELLKGRTEDSVSGNGTSAADETISGNLLPAEETVSGNVLAVQETVSGNEAEADDTLDIVVFGDSIWDDFRGSNGISEQISAALGANVYNCAIGGSAAAVKGDSTNVGDNWKSFSFNGMMYVANGDISADSLLAGRPAGEVIKQVDFSKVEYIVVSYGLNDYFSGIPVQPDASVYFYDLVSYVGSLRHGINKLKEKYPHIEIIVTSPTYGELWDQDSEITTYGGDTLDAYAQGAAQAAEECGAHFVDMYHDLGITKETLTTYTRDDVHLSEEGLRLYADYMTGFIRSILEAE